jgi:hypothetical protein
VTGSPPRLDQEAEWREEFEQIGETEIRNDLNFRSGVRVGINSEPKRQYAFQWLHEKEQQRESRERSTYRYVQWTFWAAVSAVAIGIAGVIVTIVGVIVTLVH